MAFLDTLINTVDDAKSKINEIKRKYRFRKARLRREHSVELQGALDDCRGRLELCKRDFNRAINEQSRNISAGKEKGYDTKIQEKILKDAAIGYLLVRDAIYALSTINSYEAIAHAYDLLDTAMASIGGKKTSFAKRIGSRNSYGYIKSSSALREKEEIVIGMLPSLSRNGDIEGHLERKYSVSDTENQTNSGVVDNKVSAKNDERLDNIEKKNPEVDFDQYKESLENIDPSKGKQ